MQGDGIIIYVETMFEIIVLQMHTIPTSHLGCDILTVIYHCHHNTSTGDPLYPRWLHIQV